MCVLVTDTDCRALAEDGFRIGCDLIPAVLTAENFRRDLTVELDIRSIHGGSCAIVAPTRQ
jgi:hypothetical protein